MWDWRRTIAWGRCTPLTIVDQFGIKISGFTPSFEALGSRLFTEEKEYDDENSDFAYFSCGEAKVRKTFLWLEKGP